MLLSAVRIMKGLAVVTPAFFLFGQARTANAASVQVASLRALSGGGWQDIKAPEAFPQ
jgi:hypothetical protein